MRGGKKMNYPINLVRAYKAREISRTEFCRCGKGQRDSVGLVDVDKLRLLYYNYFNNTEINNSLGGR